MFGATLCTTFVYNNTHTHIRRSSICMLSEVYVFLLCASLYHLFLMLLALVVLYVQCRHQAKRLARKLVSEMT